MAVRIGMYFTIQDAKGDASTVIIHLPDATPLNIAEQAVAAYAALIHPLATGGLREAGVTAGVNVAATWGTVAELVSDVQEKAKILFSTAQGNKTAVSIPTILESLMVPGTWLLDRANAAVAAFLTAMTDGVTVGGQTVAPVDSRNEDIATVEAAKEAWGKARH